MGCYYLCMNEVSTKESQMWRWLVNIWTLILFALMIADVTKGGTLQPLLGPVAAIYVATLAIYSAEKEFERWRLYSLRRHPGEMYVIAWTLLIIGEFVWIFATGSNYKMPPEIFSTYIVVLGILAITRKSKILFKEKQGG